VQNTYFAYHETPIGKETQLDKTVAQDVFTKGIREIIFKEGVTEEQLAVLYRAFALSQEEIAMKSGISSILWENGVSHIQVTESGLDEVIRTKTPRADDPALSRAPTRKLDPSVGQKEIVFGGRTLVLNDLMDDPVGFGASMLALAKQTRSEHESIEDRLYALYQEGGRKIREGNPDQSDILFEGLAKSVLSLEPPYREKVIVGKLYRTLDEESVNEQKETLEEQVPNDLHEIMTGRFSNEWTVPQVEELLKKSSTKKIVPPRPPFHPATSAPLEVIPLPPQLAEVARDLSEYAPEEMEALKKMSMLGMESDIIESSVRTLLFLLTLVNKSHRNDPEEKKIELFSKIVRQLEDLLSYLLKKKNYNLAVLIGQAFRNPVDQIFKPRMTEAIRKTVTQASIIETIGDMRHFVKGSPDYLAAYSYLSFMEREVTEVLLELLAEEQDRTRRKFYLDLAKEMGKNQIMLIGERLSDERWYFVRNIVNIIGESKADQSIAFLSKVARHNNFRIRQEVVKGLISIGGNQAALLLTTFLNDKEEDIQLMSIHGLVGLKGIKSDVAKPLVDFLTDRPLKRNTQELTLEVIRALGKIGSADAEPFLQGYTRIKWWKSRALQRELRAAALRAIEEIKRRGSDGGRTTR
jgi:hypothetical protein